MLKVMILYMHQQGTITVLKVLGKFFVNQIKGLSLLYRCTREYNHIHKHKQLWQQW